MTTNKIKSLERQLSSSGSVRVSSWCHQPFPRCLDVFVEFWPVLNDTAGSLLNLDPGSSENLPVSHHIVESLRVARFTSTDLTELPTCLLLNFQVVGRQSLLCKTGYLQSLPIVIPFSHSKLTEARGPRGQYTPWHWSHWEILAEWVVSCLVEFCPPTAGWNYLNTC